MKKPIVFLSFLCFFSLASLASNTKPKINTHSKVIQDQKEVKVQNSKKNKYDFSLFKFITPSKSNHQTDSLPPNLQENKAKNSFEETSIHYEKPRAFLMFS